MVCAHIFFDAIIIAFGKESRKRDRERPKSYHTHGALAFGLRTQIEREKIKIEIDTMPVRSFSSPLFAGMALLRYTCCTSFQLGWWGYAVILLIMNNAPQCLSQWILCACARSAIASRDRHAMHFFMIQFFFAFFLSVLQVEEESLIVKMTFIRLIACGD